MQNTESIFPQDVYAAHLTVINDVSFTRREIDIMACLLCARKTSKIATFLSISPKTVVNHIRNIMVKAETNSRDGIIDFLEKSPKFLMLREYYSSLVIHSFFKNCLKRISALKHEGSPAYLILSLENENLKKTISHYLKEHLAMANVKVELLEYHADLEIKKIGNQDLNTLILIKEKNKKELPKELLSANFIDLDKQQNYYFLVFEILKKLFPNVKLEIIFAEFKEQFENKNVSLENEFPSPSMAKNKGKITKKIVYVLTNKKWQVPILLFLVTLLGIGFFLIKSKNSETRHLSHFRENNRDIYKDPTIRSDLVVPKGAVILHRPELINKMDEAYKYQGGIRSVALVGAGGAGKTTLAREYAHQQKSNIIWEINAENKESLKESFERIAEKLAKTEEERNELKNIQIIKDPLKQEERLLLFVKKCFKSNSNWFLIFDNVESFSDIQKYYPLDLHVWGEGKILLTTRDSNIKNNNHVNCIIFVGELNSDQKLTLFKNIITQESNLSFTPAQIEEAKQFLEQVPSYPLDVSVASHYIKATSVSYAEYIDRMHVYDKEFNIMQKNILKELGNNYNKTRYAIISLSLQHLINAHKDFPELLLLIALLDSQNIPRSLLNIYKNKFIVDNFIFHLKKYSLITNESSGSSLGYTFSIHRSSQSIALSFIVKVLNLERRNDLLVPIINVLENYIIDAVDKEDISKMKLMIVHCNTISGHNLLLKNSIKGSISIVRGGIYSYLGDYVKAEQFLKEGLSSLMNFNKKDHNKIAWILLRLGDVYNELGYYEKAKNRLEESIELYKKYFGENYYQIARASADLGYSHKELGNYTKAAGYLEKSLNIYKNYFPNDYCGIVWNYLYFGYLYQDLGEYNKAKYSYEKALHICERNLPKNHINVAWVLSHLGNIYRELRDYRSAKEFIDKSLVICKQHFPDNHVGLAVLIEHQGNLYKDLGDYRKARTCYERALSIFNNHYYENHVRIGRTLRELSKVNFLEGLYEKSEKHLFASLKKFQKNRHPEIYMVLEELSDLYKVKSINSAKGGESSQTQLFRERDVSYLNQAFDFVKEQFPKDSPHIKRIQSKIENLK